MTTDEEDPWANVPHAAPIQSTNQPPSEDTLSNNLQQGQGGGRPPPKRKASAFASFPNSPTISQNGLSTAGENDDEEEMEEGDEEEEEAEWGSSRGALGRGARTERTSSRWASAVRRRWGKVKKFAKRVNEL